MNSPGDRVYILHRGRIQAEGPTRQRLADERLLAAYQLEVPLSLRYELAAKDTSVS